MIDSNETEKIAKIYYKAVYSHCLFLVKDKFEAEDLTQNVFLLFEQKRKELDSEHIKAWLYKATDTLVKEYYRKQKKAEILEIKDNDIIIADILECIEKEYPITPEEIEEKKQIIFNALSEKEVKIFKMHKEENKTYKQIAEELNMTENAVNMCAIRTRRKITTMAKHITSQWALLLLVKIFF